MQLPCAFFSLYQYKVSNDSVYDIVCESRQNRLPDLRSRPSVLSGSFEASLAIYRAVIRRLERNARYTTALCAGGLEILTSGTVAILLRIAASLAALGLIHKALFLVELLFTSGENKFVAAVLADQGLVFKYFRSYVLVKHGCYLTLDNVPLAASNRTSAEAMLGA